MEGISTELIEFSETKIKLCRITKRGRCFACSNKWNYIFKDDDFYKIFEKIKEADDIILDSPGITGEMKGFLDCIGIASISNPEILRHKVGASVSAVRRADFF